MCHFFFSLPTAIFIGFLLFSPLQQGVFSGSLKFSSSLSLSLSHSTSSNNVVKQNVLPNELGEIRLHSMHQNAIVNRITTEVLVDTGAYWTFCWREQIKVFCYEPEMDIHDWEKLTSKCLAQIYFMDRWVAATLVEFATEWLWGDNVILGREVIAKLEAVTFDFTNMGTAAVPSVPIVVDRVWVYGTFNNRSVKALLDTGSDVSNIRSQQVAERICPPNPIEECQRPPVFYGGRHCEVLGMCGGRLLLLDKEIDHLWVINHEHEITPPEDLIIGKDLMKLLGPITFKIKYPDPEEPEWPPVASTCSKHPDAAGSSAQCTGR